MREPVTTISSSDAGAPASAASAPYGANIEAPASAPARDVVTDNERM